LEKQNKIKVLYLDDEPNNLICFMASFRFDYTIFIAPNAEKAIEFLQAHPDVSVVLADQRMPGKTGVDFFEEIRELYPSPVRMLITAFSDIEAVIDAVNKGSIFRYIKKPWSDDEIKSAIDEAHKYYISTTMLAAKNVELQAAYEELGKFAYSVAHDLRGPLLSVLGALEIARDINSVDEMREILGMMELSLTKLDDFVQSIHEYYTLKKGLVSSDKIDFATLIHDMTNLYASGSKTNNIRFDLSVSQDGEFTTDLISLKIILSNLITNAVKYQKKNETDKYVAVTVIANSFRAEIEVADNGIGIREEYIDRIFDIFYRATSEQTGSGFGLYNVKDALRKISGDIVVQSQIGVGSKFKVTIPNMNNGRN